MFLAILNAMLASAPPFIRTAVGWLVTGLRNLTNYISARWNEIGTAFNTWYQRVVFWVGSVAIFVSTLRTFVTWLITVRIPGAVSSAVDSVVSVVNATIKGVRDGLFAALVQLQQWVSQFVSWLAGRLAGLEAFVSDWIDRLTVGLNNLVRLLGHVLNGPVVLAEWLVGAMWGATLRLLYRERDRVVSWLTRESVAFTRWLTLELENVVMRWLG